MWDFFLGWYRFLKLMYNFVNVRKNHWTVHFQRMKYMVCEFYLNKGGKYRATIKYLFCLSYMNLYHRMSKQWWITTFHYTNIPINKWRRNDRIKVSQWIKGSRHWISTAANTTKRQPDIRCLLIKEYNITCSPAKRI